MQTEFDIKLRPFAERLINQIVDLSELAFGHADQQHVRWRLSNMPEASIFTAHRGETLLAFKAGYAMSESKYYSWLGAVHPGDRRRGLASQLMRQQHTWLAEQGYLLVETAANQDNRPMAAANLKHGFKIAGTRRNPDNTQILFLKVLNRAEKA